MFIGLPQRRAHRAAASRWLAAQADLPHREPLRVGGLMSTTSRAGAVSHPPALARRSSRAGNKHPHAAGGSSHQSEARPARDVETIVMDAKLIRPAACATAHRNLILLRNRRLMEWGSKSFRASTAHLYHRPRDRMGRRRPRGQRLSRRLATLADQARASGMISAPIHQAVSHSSCHQQRASRPKRLPPDRL